MTFSGQDQDSEILGPMVNQAERFDGKLHPKKTDGFGRGRLFRLVARRGGQYRVGSPDLWFVGRMSGGIGRLLGNFLSDDQAA